MYLKFTPNNRLPLPAYSNLGYISAPDLTIDKPLIYSIEQQYSSKNDIHV